MKKSYIYFYLAIVISYIQLAVLKDPMAAIWSLLVLIAISLSVLIEIGVDK